MRELLGLGEQVWLSGVWMDFLLIALSYLFIYRLEKMDERHLKSAIVFAAQFLVIEVIRFAFVFHNMDFRMTHEFVVRFIVILIGMTLCYRKICWEILYCSVWPILLFYCIAMIWKFVESLLNEHGISVFLKFIFLTLFFVIAYVVLMVTIIKWMPRNGKYHAGPKRSISALVVLFFEQYSFYEYCMDPTIPRLTIMVQIYCVTFLYLQAELFKKSEINQELNMLDQLWHQEKKQYMIAKEQMQVIDRKCHDLKYQIEAMRHMDNPVERDQTLLELEQSVQIYDAIVKTGNEILDTILSEKGLICEARKIKIHCVVDGDKLHFMNPVDVYSMFGNAIDNAIECVQKFDDPEKRFIDVLVTEKQKFLYIRISNPISDQPEYDEDLPKTTKKNKQYHGFGLKSIRHIAQKYGGDIVVETEMNCFVLEILLPM